jgi:hypothetical protein
MLNCLFTYPFDVTSTKLITCGAGIKQQSNNCSHTLQGRPVTFTWVCVPQFAFYIYYRSYVGDPTLQCEGKEEHNVILTSFGVAYRQACFLSTLPDDSTVY